MYVYIYIYFRLIDELVIFSDKESLGHFLQTGLTAKKHRDIVAKSKALLSLHL